MPTTPHCLLLHYWSALPPAPLPATKKVSRSLLLSFKKFPYSYFFHLHDLCSLSMVLKWAKPKRGAIQPFSTIHLITNFEAAFNTSLLSSLNSDRGCREVIASLYHALLQWQSLAASGNSFFISRRNLYCARSWMIGEAALINGFSLLFGELVSKVAFSTYLEAFFSCGKNFCIFLYKDNFTVIFFWKLHVLKLLVNYFSGTLMISMGYIIGNFTVGSTEISD